MQTLALYTPVQLTNSCFENSATKPSRDEYLKAYRYINENFEAITLMIYQAFKDGKETFTFDIPEIID